MITLINSICSPGYLTHGKALAIGVSDLKYTSACFLPVWPYCSLLSGSDGIIESLTSLSPRWFPVIALLLLLWIMLTLILSFILKGRMKSNNSPFLQDLLQQARTSPHSNLIPSDVCLTSPGGPMVHSLSGQSQPSTALSVSDDGKLVVSASSDSSCSIWEVSSGKLVRALENAGECWRSRNSSALTPWQ